MFDWKKIGAYGAGILSAVVVCVVYFSGGNTEKQLHAAQVAFDRWKLEPTDASLEKRMHSALDKVPELKKALQAEMAQTLLAAGQVSNAETAGKTCLQQLEKEAPLHARFAHTTFLIEKKQYQAALQEAVALKEKVKSPSILYGYNLLRIAFLQKQLANSAGELAAWKELKSLQPLSEPAQLLDANFQKRAGKKSFALTDFIAQREKKLTH